MLLLFAQLLNIVMPRYLYSPWWSSITDIYLKVLA